MKRIDYVIAGLLIIIGLVCLTTSGSLLVGSNSNVYMTTFVQLCMWLGMPLVGIGLMYFLILFFTKKVK